MAKSNTDRRAARRDDDEGGVPCPDYLPDEILELLRTELSVGPEIAGKALGLGRTSSYAACRCGDIPAFRVGSKFIVPTSKLREMLGIESLPLPPPVPLAPLEQASPRRRQRRRKR